MPRFAGLSWMPASKPPRSRCGEQLPVAGAAAARGAGCRAASASCATEKARMSTAIASRAHIAPLPLTAPTAPYSMPHATPAQATSPPALLAKFVALSPPAARISFV